MGDVVGSQSKVGLDRSKTGRKKGTPNKTTGALKEAILLAAKQVGADGKGKDGLVGYLRLVATSDVKAFASLLGRVLPLQVSDPNGNPIAPTTIVIAAAGHDDGSD